MSAVEREDGQGPAGASVAETTLRLDEEVRGRRRAEARVAELEALLGDADPEGLADRLEAERRRLADEVVELQRQADEHSGARSAAEEELARARQALVELERSREDTSSSDAALVFAATQARIEMEGALAAAEGRVAGLVAEVESQAVARAEAERVARESAVALDAAEARAAGLAAQLADLRERTAAADSLAPETDARVGALGDPLFDAVPVARVEPVVEPAPEPRVTPVLVAPAPAEPEQAAGPVPDPPSGDGSYSSTRGGGPLGAVVGLLALAGLGTVALLVVRDELFTVPGLTACAVTGLLLLAALLRTSSSRSVTLEAGTLRLDLGNSQHTFHLTSASTRLEMVGQPGDRDWQVLVLRRGMPPVVIDARSVEPRAFTDAVRHWRPDL